MGNADHDTAGVVLPLRSRRLRVVRGDVVLESPSAVSARIREGCLFVDDADGSITIVPLHAIDEIQLGEEP